MKPETTKEIGESMGNLGGVVRVDVLEGIVFGGGYSRYAIRLIISDGKILKRREDRRRSKANNGLNSNGRD